MKLNHPSEMKRDIPKHIADKAIDFQGTRDELNDQRDIALNKLHKTGRDE